MFKNYIKLFSIVAALIAPFAAHGLADAAAPTKIQIPFANGAGGAYVRTVPVASQIGIQNGAASYTDGFPPLNFTPVNAGGVPPFGQDMNGILRDVSAHARWWAAGGPVYYDSTYQTAIGGYPKGAVVQSTTVTGKLWFSSTENNVTNPDTGGAGWSPVMNTVYAPLTGTGASGTWGINITGNAATANNATSATNATNSTNVYQDNDPAAGTYRMLLGNGSDVNAAVHNFSTLYYNSAAGEIQGAGANISGNAATANSATTATNQSGGTVSATTVSATTSYSLNGKLLASSTSPVIGACGTSPSVTHSNGTAAFTINVGSGGTAVGCSVSMPLLSAPWICVASQMSEAVVPPANQVLRISTGNNIVSIFSYNGATNAGLPFSANQSIYVMCSGE